jgi:phosphate transport system substrate-binding protein
VKTLRHGSRARVAAVGVAAGVLLAGCGAANEQAPAGGSGGAPAGGPALSRTISGAGASSQQAAMQAWIAGITGANPDATVNYDPSGSGAGRTQFVAGGVAFAGSDAYLKEEELTQAQQRCGRGRGSRVHLPDRGDLQPARRH